MEPLQGPDATRTQVSAQGMKFKVTYTSSSAIAYRTDFLRPSKFHLVPEAAIEAIELASGCRVKPNSVNGDPARVTAKLAC